MIKGCETPEELDFLFPEIMRLCQHDLVALELWQNQINWMRSLSPADLKLLQSADFSPPDATPTPTPSLDTAPPELSFYETLQQKSHPESLLDQLQWIVQPKLRQKSETYINQKAFTAGYKSLIPENLKIASDLTIANLYWYFKFKEGQIPEHFL